MLIAFTRETALVTCILLWCISACVRTYMRDRFDECVHEIAQIVVDGAPWFAVSKPDPTRESALRETAMTCGNVYRAARKVSALFAMLSLLSLTLNIVRIVKVL